MIGINVDTELPLSNIVHGLIDAVAEDLSMAAESKSSMRVHELRIATRRALVGIELLQSVCPSSERKWFEKKLRQVRHAAGEVRDLDVMLERHAKNSRLMRKLTKRRTRSFNTIIDVHRSLIDEGRFAKHQRRLLEPLMRLNDSESLIDKDLCIESFNLIVADFLAAAYPMSFKVQKLHQLRKRGKHLRYALEIMSDFLPQDSVQRLQTTTKLLQSRLGSINDHVVAIQCIASLKKKTKNKRTQKEMQRLISNERRMLKESIRHLKTWWTPVLLGELEEIATLELKRVDTAEQVPSMTAAGETSANEDDNRVC